jgi:hypothetical protein
VNIATTFPAGDLTEPRDEVGKRTCAVTERYMLTQKEVQQVIWIFVVVGAFKLLALMAQHRISLPWVPGHIQARNAQTWKNDPRARHVTYLGRGGRGSYSVESQTQATPESEQFPRTWPRPFLGESR